MSQSRSPMYEGMSFPPYEFVEYPKLVDLPSGGQLRANNAKEEEEILRQHYPKPEPKIESKPKASS